jgi:hypothetical protein
MNGLTARGSITRGARGLFAKLQNLRAVSYPDAPALAVRDPWPGDPSRGVRLIKGELSLLGASHRCRPRPRPRDGVRFHGHGRA